MYLCLIDIHTGSNRDFETFESVGNFGKIADKVETLTVFGGMEGVIKEGIKLNI